MYFMPPVSAVFSVFILRYVAVVVSKRFTTRVGPDPPPPTATHQLAVCVCVTEKDHEMHASRVRACSAASEHGR